MSTPIKALLVDDERLARKWLASLLQAHPEITIAGEAGTIEAAAKLAKEIGPDLIFLDIQMPPENGFDLLPLLNPVPRVVFVTAYDNYAVRAFESNALDYLLKPVHPERLAQTLQRLGDPASPHSFPPSSDAMGRLQVDDLLSLRDGALLRMVRVREITFIEAEGAYTKVHLSDQRPMILLRRLQEWETALPSPPFVRIGRSVILNLSKIRSTHARHRDETRVELEGTEPLHLGRLAAQRLRKMMRGA